MKKYALDMNECSSIETLGKGIANSPVKSTQESNTHHYESKAGRKRFTTMLHPGLKKSLILYAHDRNVSIADVIEKAVQVYMKVND